MYFVLLYSAANPPLKKTRIMGQVSFHKEFWDRYWRRTLQLIGSVSRSRKKKIRPVWSKIRGGRGVDSLCPLPYRTFKPRVVTKISSCRVNTTSRHGIKRLGISFDSIFLLFFNKSSQGALS